MPRMFFSLLLAVVLSSFSNVLGFPPVMAIQDPPKSALVFTTEEIYDPTFLETLRFKPIKFTERKGTTLTGHFANKLTEAKVLLPIDFVFITLPDKRGDFFKVMPDKETVITYDQFLKKYKENYWFVIYREVGEDKVIYQAHQLDSPLVLATSYAQDDQYLSIENLEYWDAMRLTVVNFYAFNKSESKAYWRFIKPTDQNRPWTEDDKSIIEYEWRDLSGTRFTTTKRLHYGDGGDDSLVLDHGVMEISPVCVYNREDAINGTVQDVPRTYFEENYSKLIWAVYYNPDTKIALRLITNIIPQKQP